LTFETFQANTPLPAQPAAEGRPGVGVRAEAVMHVDRADARMVLQEMEQDHRVDAAGKADGDALLTLRLQERPRASARRIP
jgi:hypothetical protein